MLFQPIYNIVASHCKACMSDITLIDKSTCDKAICSVSRQILFTTHSVITSSSHLQLYTGNCESCTLTSEKVLFSCRLCTAQP